MFAILTLGCIAGFAAWLHQLDQGLAVTGLGRDVPWGLYIGMFTFLVGVAASAIVVVLPAIWGVPGFARIAVFGETLAVVAVGMAMLCVVADLGQPSRLLGILLHPAPGSILFWDLLALTAYLLLNLSLCTTLIRTTRQALPPPAHLRMLLWPTVLLAVTIHVITAWIYAGLAARHFWLTGLLALKFLASAGASGPAVLLLLLYGLRRLGLNPHPQIGASVPALTRVITIACALCLFCTGLEAFTALYSGLPAARLAYTVLFDGPLAPLFAGGLALAVLTLGLLLHLLTTPHTLTTSRLLPWLLSAVVLTVWIDKVPALLLGGFATLPADTLAYLPRATELLVVTGILSAGGLVLLFWWRHIVGTALPSG